MNMSRDQQLGNYRLIRLLGRGGFADTYLGEQIYLHTPAAIKVIQAPLAHDCYESFFTEAQLIAGLKHPNIVRLLDFGIESSRNIPYLVMEYAPNGTLRQRYPRGEVVAVSALVPYVKQVAVALDYAHEQKIIHRDVKPENMLVGVGNEILLADFGIAVVESTRMQTQPMIAGTVSYMAPEQIQGKPVPASDQYALAAVVYEWLCGTAPFTGSYAEVAIQQRYNTPIPLREHLARIPADVEQVVLIALAKDPHQRFESVQAFATALEQASRAVPRALSVPATPAGDRFSEIPTLPASDAHLPQEPSAYQASPLASGGEAVQTAYGQRASSGPVPTPSGGQGPFTPLPPVPESSAPRLTPQVTPVLTPDSQHVSAGQPPFQPASIQSVPAGSRNLTIFSRWLIIANIAVLLLLLGGGILAYAISYQPYVQSLQHQLAAQQQQIAALQRQLAPYVENPYTHQGKLVLSDPLSDNSKGVQWAQDPTNCAFLDGAYHVKAPDPNYADDCYAQASSYSNFVFEVQAWIMKGDGGAIIFRNSDTAQTFRDYEFTVLQDGSYDLGMYNTPISTGTWTSLKKGSSEAIQRGLNQLNLLAVVAQGSTIRVYVNHQQIASITNSTFSQGRIGLQADPYGSHPTEVVFSNARVWELT